MKVSLKSIAFLGFSLLLGGVGGAIGAASLLIAHRQVSIGAAAMVTTIVTVIGWAVTTVWSFRNQRQLLKYQILNEARLQLAEAIRAEQDWGSSLSILGYSLQNALTLRSSLPPEVRDKEWDYWYKQNEKARARMYKETAPGRMLVMVLEEYEILYPETRRLRQQLSSRKISISETFNLLIMDLVIDGQRERAIAEMVAQSGNVMDYTAVLEDLRCHVQNRSISPLFGGAKIPPRVPLDSNAALTTTDAQGQLCVMERGESWPNGSSIDDSASKPQSATPC